MMSRTEHSKKLRHVEGIHREGSNRAKVRAALVNGNWDDMPTTMPTRAMRGPVVL